MIKTCFSVTPPLQEQEDSHPSENGSPRPPDVAYFYSESLTRQAQSHAVTKYEGQRWRIIKLRGGGLVSLKLRGSQNTDSRPERQQDYNWIIHTLSGPGSKIHQRTMIVIVVLSIQQNIVDLVKKDRCNLSSDMWNIFSMFQSPIFGKSSLTLSVFVIFIWPMRRVRAMENIEMTNACFVIFCRAKLWLNMNRYAQGIYVCETNSKMEFFTAQCTQNTLLLYNNIKIPRNTKNN